LTIGLVDTEADIDAIAWLFMGVGQTIDMATLLEMPEAINPDILQSMEQLFRRAMSYRRETSAT